MILNTGGRTDTVQYYSEWLLNRFREGYVLSRNPLFPNLVNRIELNPDTIDVVVFCSKDYSPILGRLHEISDRFNCYYHYTITAYGTDIEPRVPPIRQSIDTLKLLAAQVGREKITWKPLSSWHGNLPHTSTAAYSVSWRCTRNWKQTCRSCVPSVRRTSCDWRKVWGLLPGNTDCYSRHVPRPTNTSNMASSAADA